VQGSLLSGHGGLHRHHRGTTKARAIAAAIRSHFRRTSRGVSLRNSRPPAYDESHAASARVSSTFTTSLAMFASLHWTLLGWRVTNARGLSVHGASQRENAEAGILVGST